MHAVILDGSTKREAGLAEVHTYLCQALHAAGWSVESLRLADMNIRPCVGCFACWVKTPGECCQADDGRRVARALVQCGVRPSYSNPHQRPAV